MLPIGVSSYSDGTATSPHGKEQFLQDEAARQCIALQNAVNQHAGYNAPGKPRFTVNEGLRDDARCTELWNGYVARGKTPPVVASPFTSNHHPGLATDWGITMPDGSNRAMTPDEVGLLDSILPDFGFKADGYNFGELWHKGYYGNPKLVAPVGITLDVYTAPAPAPAPKPLEEEEEMFLIRNPVGGKVYNVGPGICISIVHEQDWPAILQANRQDTCWRGGADLATAKADFARILFSRGISSVSKLPTLGQIKKY